MAAKRAVRFATTDRPIAAQALYYRTAQQPSYLLTLIVSGSLYRPNLVRQNAQNELFEIGDLH